MGEGARAVLAVLLVVGVEFVGVVPGVGVDNGAGGAGDPVNLSGPHCAVVGPCAFDAVGKEQFVAGVVGVVGVGPDIGAASDGVNAVRGKRRGQVLPSWRCRELLCDPRRFDSARQDLVSNLSSPA